MKTKELLCFSALCACVSFSFTACSDDDDNGGQGGSTSEQQRGVYIMNSGKWQSNNATLDYYDFETKDLNTKVFSSVNGRGLGDTANDIMVYGSKMYITVSESNTVEITDLNAKSLNSV